jgi:hypothetical protein
MGGVGMVWLIEGAQAWRLVGLICGVALGLAKSQLVLDATALGTVERIRRQGDDRCLGGFQSLRAWLLVLAMVLGGRAARLWFLTPELAGILYLAVGSGLLRSSRIHWAAFSRDAR